MPVQLPAPSTLEDIFKMNPAAFNQAQGMLDLGTQQGQVDLQKTQLQNLFDQQNDPLRVQHQQLQNQGLEAGLPGIFADSTNKQLDSQKKLSTQDEAIAAARKKFLADASDDDLKMLENEGQRMAYSMDPQTRAHGEQILSMHKDMIRDRIKQTAQQGRMISQIKETGSQARQTQQQAIDAGKFNRGSKVVLTLDQAIDNAKSAKERHQKLLDAATQAKQAGDMDAYNNYIQRAEIVRPQAEAEIASQKPGQIDAPAITGLPQTAGPQIAPGDTRASKVPPELPQGTKINPDGTFTLPDGTKIRKKAK